MALFDRLRGLRSNSKHSLASEVAPGVFVGAPLDARGVEKLYRAGFRSIVNLDREGEPGELLSPNVEASWAHTFELEHARVSIGPDVREDDVERLRGLLGTLRRPIYVRSLDVERALVLSLACVGRLESWSGERAQREAESHALPPAPLKQLLELLLHASLPVPREPRPSASF